MSETISISHKITPFKYFAEHLHFKYGFYIKLELLTLIKKGVETAAVAQWVKSFAS